jgi:transposase
VVCPTPAQQLVCQEYVHAVNEHTARLERLEQALKEPVQSWRLHPVVEALQALRGVQFTVAVTLVAELGDLTRFDHPTELMQYLGLTPSEYTSGERRRHGSITKAGHTHARRVLVEGAWAYRDPAQVSRPLQRRRENPSNVIQAISWKAQVRLCTRYRRLLARGKHANQVVVAMARAFVGCMWAMAKQVPVTPSALKTEHGQSCNPEGCQRAWEEAQPRCGVTLDGVKRPIGHTRA